MTSPSTTPSAGDVAVSPSEKARFLEAYEREHAITMKVLRAFPPERGDLRPAPTSNTARDLAWIFVMERRLGAAILDDGIVARMSAPGGAKPPAPPERWEDLLATLEEAHREFGERVRATPEGELAKTSKFFVAPKTMGDVHRMQFLWFLLHDQIHHRGQFSVYLRVAGAKVPSIYGPSRDEPWT